MKVKIRNNISILDPPQELQQVLFDELVFPNPKYETAVKYNTSTYKIPKVISLIIVEGTTLYVPRGYLTRLFEVFNGLGIVPEVEDYRLDHFIEGAISSSIVLRAYQEEAINQLLQSTEGVLKAPAGSGKTVMGLSLIPKLKQRTLWITHTGPLASQVLERVEQFLPSVHEHGVGLIGNAKWKVGDDLTVGMVQTLSKNTDRLAEIANTFGLIVLDEAHHTPAKTFTEVIREFNPKHLYGLTATDRRRDGLERALFTTIGPIRAEVSREIVSQQEGVMTPYLVVRKTGWDATPEELDDDRYSTLIKALVFDEERNRLIINDVLHEASFGNICIVVTERKEHAEILYEGISEFWPLTGIATGNYSKKKVQEQVRRLEAREISTLIATTSLLGEGFDHAPLSRLFMTLPFRNEARCEQVVGRVQRTSEGKENSVVFDYLDSHGMLRHQFDNNTGKDCRLNVYKALGCIIL